MSQPLSPKRDPKLADYRDQVMRRDLRICDWLGMSPAHVFRLDDDDPNEHGEVEIHWESAVMENPRHGQITQVGARGGWDEPTTHSGTLRLHPIDVEKLLEVAGPKPAFPISPEDLVALGAMRTDRPWPL